MLRFFRKPQLLNPLQVAFLFAAILWGEPDDDDVLLREIRERGTANERTIRGELFTFHMMALTMALMQRDFKNVSSQEVYNFTTFLTTAWLRSPEEVPPAERKANEDYVAFIKSCLSSADPGARNRIERGRVFMPNFEHHATRFTEYYEVLQSHPTEESSRRAVVRALAANVGLPDDPIVMLKAYIVIGERENMYRTMLPEA